MSHNNQQPYQIPPPPPPPFSPRFPPPTCTSYILPPPPVRPPYSLPTPPMPPPTGNESITTSYISLPPAPAPTRNEDISELASGFDTLRVSNVPPSIPPPIPPRPTTNDLQQAAQRVQQYSVPQGVVSDGRPVHSFNDSHPPNPTSPATRNHSSRSLPLPARPLLKCPENATTPYPTWYQVIPAATNDLNTLTDSFDICACCYTEHIYPTSLATPENFRKIEYPRYRKTSCDFNTIRVKWLWDQCVAAGNVTLLREYAAARPTVQKCEGTSAMNGGEAYMTDDIPDFVMCPACYEDYNALAMFPGKLERKVMGKGWICDMPLRYIQRVWKQCVETKEWETFVERAKHRLQVTCKGVGVQAGVSQFYTIAQPLMPELAICEACYLDFVRLSPYEDQFILHNAGHTEWSCDMRELPLLVPWETSVDWKYDFNQFLESTRTFVSNPCNPKGMPTAGRTWYTLRNGNYNWGICPSHYTGLVLPYLTPAQAAAVFEVRDVTHWGESFICDFNPKSSDRSKEYLLKLAEALDCQDMSIFESLVAALSPIPLCPNCAGAKNRNWYAPPDSPLVTVCEECFVTQIAGTPFEPQFSPTGIDRLETRCNLYSPRMRDLYILSLTKQDFSLFLAPAQKRAETFMELWPQFVMLQFQENQRRTQQIYTSSMANMNMIADVASGIHYGGSYTTYRSSSGATYNSLSGVEAEKYRDQSNSLMTSGMGGQMQLARVKAILKSVE